MASYDLNTAKQQISNYTQSKYGRAPTDDEWAQIGQGIDYSSGQISEDQLQQAYGNVGNIASSYGAPTYPAPVSSAAAPAPSQLQAPTPPAQTSGGAGTVFAGVDPASTQTGTQALTALQQRIGRPLTPQELQQAQQLIGYSDPTGNAPISGAQYNTLLQTVAGLTGGATYTPYVGTNTPAAPAAPAAPAPAAAPAPTGPRAPTYPTNVPSNLQGTVENLFQQQPASPIQTAYQDSILKLIQQSQAPVSLSDPNLAQQSDVYRASRQRGTERQRSALAERAAQTGTLGAGGFDTAVGNLYGDESADIAGNDASLVKGEMDARRQQLVQALTLAQQTGNAEEARQLQTMLALLDASVSESQFARELAFRNTALEQQGELGQGELDLRGDLGHSDLALRLLALLTGNDYNYDVLGSNNAFRLADLNQGYIQTLLGR